LKTRKTSVQRTASDGAGSRAARRGSPQDCEEPRLEQQRVPLERQELLPDHGERQIKQPEEREHEARRHTEHEEHAEGGAAPRGEPERRVAGAEPEDGGEELIRRSAVRPVRPLEERAGGQDSAIADEADHLHRKRREGDDVDDPDEPKEEPAGDAIARRAGRDGVHA
jgi:hypothetical protein